MYEIISEQDGQAVGITARGTVTPDEQAQIAAFVQARLDEHDAVHVLIDADGIRREDAEAMATGFPGHVAGRHKIGRLAVVGEEFWERWQGYVQAYLPQADVQFFRPLHLAEAWSWVRGKV
jgi:hypothetical protein